MIIPNIWENKVDVPNHQPETHGFSTTAFANGFKSGYLIGDGLGWCSWCRWWIRPVFDPIEISRYIPLSFPSGMSCGMSKIPAHSWWIVFFLVMLNHGSKQPKASCISAADGDCSNPRAGFRRNTFAHGNAETPKRFPDVGGRCVSFSKAGGLCRLHIDHAVYHIILTVMHETMLCDVVKQQYHIWLVVRPPLWKIWVNWDDDIPNIWENKKCSKPPTRHWREWRTRPQGASGMVSDNGVLWNGHPLEHAPKITENRQSQESNCEIWLVGG